MRKLGSPILAIALVVSLGAAGLAVAQPTIVRVGNLVVRLDGDVAPKRLPANRLAPIALRIAGGISTNDGAHPPATRTVTAEFDRHGTIDARGLATCRSGQLQARDTPSARAVCRAAIVGSGRTTVQVAFPEQAPFTSSGPLVLFNGGVRRGVTTMFIHAYVNIPAPTAIVTQVRIQKIRKGRFGTRAVARIPVIAGGSGSVTSFSMRIKRTFRHRGKSRSYLRARCATGRFFARAEVAFAGGTRARGTVVRSCRPRR